MGKNMKTVYVTKYGLTRGILEYEEENPEPTESGALWLKNRLYLRKGDFFFTREEAEEEVREQARRRLRALEREKQKMLGIIATAAPPAAKRHETRGFVSNSKTRVYANSASGTMRKAKRK